MMKKKGLLVFLIVGAFFVFTLPGYATLLIYDLDFEYSGGTNPAGSPPWLTAKFDDDADQLAEGAVRLTMDANGLTGTEKVGKWVFNANGNDLFFNNLSIDFNPDFSNTDPPPINSIRTVPGPPPIDAGPAKEFDIEFDFLTNGNNFDVGDVISFDFSVDGLPLSVDIFDDFNSAPKGPYFQTAAHVQSIGKSAGSGWIAPNPNSPSPVPEPTTMLLVGIGMIGLIGFGYKRSKA
jgi:hypothetical protein